MAKRNHKSKKLSHYDAAGRASMVDVSAKQPTLREAEARDLLRPQSRLLRICPRLNRYLVPAAFNPNQKL